MRWSLDTLVARTMLLLLIGIGLVHVVSLSAYQHALTSEVTLANDARLAERMLTIRRSVMRLAPVEREAAAHELSGGPLEAHWSASDKAASGGAGASHWAGLAQQLKTQGDDLGPQDIVLGSIDPHLALVSLRLPDGSWLNVTAFSSLATPQSGHGTVLSTSLMALGVVLVSVLVVGWLTRPLRNVAQAARALYAHADQAPLPENGPREVRDVAQAFNEMQERIAKLIDTRTQTLAAVSHDLKTPLTRLRLRAEGLKDPRLAAAMTGDIREMERMLDQTLQHLRGARDDESARPLELVALIQTLVDEAQDAGGIASLDAPVSVVLFGHPLALKRAFSNLIDNALKYGGEARLSVAQATATVQVTIADSGPGIPADQREAVFEPFVRLETSRSKETGGFGLGLAIARTAIIAHGGSIVLEEAQGGGLLVKVFLPLQSHPPN